MARACSFAAARWFLVGLIGLGSVLSAQGDVLRSWVLPGETFSAYPNFPAPIVLGDVTGDDLPEMLLAYPGKDFGRQEDVGIVFVLSGEETPGGEPPRIVRSHVGSAPDDYYGAGLAALGDVNGDGWRDYAIGTSTYADAPRITVFSGRDGTLLFEKPGEVGVLLGLADLDGDDLAESLLGTAVHRGGSFELLYRIPRTGEYEGASALPLDDVDGDGVQDLLYNRYSYGDRDFASSTTYAISGRTGSHLHRHGIDGPGATDGISAPGDVDGDGDPDFVESNDGNPPIRYRDGATGDYIGFPRLPDRVGSYDGYLLGSLSGDLDGNGHPELFLQGRGLMAVDTGTGEVVWQLNEYGIRSGGLDWNDDGFQDFALRRRLGSTPDSTLEIRSGAPARAATATEPRTGIRALGAPCSPAPGRELRVGASGLPLIGKDLRVHVSNLGAPGLAVLVLGEPRPGASLLPAGDCRSLLRPELVRAVEAHEARPGEWVASTAIAIPPEPALAGSIFHLQWLVPGPRTRPLRSTRVLECQIGIDEHFPTEIAGRVQLADGRPVPGASVEVFGEELATTTLDDGSFVLSNVPILPWNPGLQAVATVDGRVMSGVIESLAPIPGRRTSAGAIVLRPGPRALVLGADSAVGDGSTEDGSFSLLLALESIGWAREDLVLQREPPALLTPYAVVWNIPLFDVSRLAQRRLSEFAAAGGRLHFSLDRNRYPPTLFGPDPHGDFSPHGLPLTSWLNALVASGSVRIAWEGVGRSLCFNPDAADEAALVPNDLLRSCQDDYPHFRPTLHGVFGPNVLLRSQNGSVLDALWTEADLAAGRGRIAVTSAAGSYAWVMENVQAFLTDPSPTQVAGMVLLPDGTPLANARVELPRLGLETRSSSDGSFGFADVSSRHRELTVLALASNGGRSYSGTASAPPEADGLTVLDVRLAPVDPVLLFDRYATSAKALEQDLVAAGTSSILALPALPADLSPFGVIWDVNGEPSSNAEQHRLAAFVRAGGGLHLTSLQPQLLEEVVLTGHVSPGPHAASALRFDPDARGEITHAPNELARWYPYSAWTLLGVSGANALVRDRSGSGAPAGAVWGPAELDGGRGRLTLLMDWGWFTQENDSRRAVVENLQRFLERQSGGRSGR